MGDMVKDALMPLIWPPTVRPLPTPKIPSVYEMFLSSKREGGRGEHGVLVVPGGERSEASGFLSESDN